MRPLSSLFKTREPPPVGDGACHPYEAFVFTIQNPRTPPIGDGAWHPYEAFVFTLQTPFFGAVDAAHSPVAAVNSEVEQSILFCRSSRIQKSPRGDTLLLVGGSPSYSFWPRAPCPSLRACPRSLHPVRRRRRIPYPPPTIL